MCWTVGGRRRRVGASVRRSSTAGYATETTDRRSPRSSRSSGRLGAQRDAARLADAVVDPTLLPRPPRWPTPHWTPALRAEGRSLAAHLAGQTSTTSAPAVPRLRGAGRRGAPMSRRSPGGRSSEVEAGASMVKVKIAPGHDIDVIRAVRDESAGPGRRRCERVAGRRRSARRRRCGSASSIWSNPGRPIAASMRRPGGRRRRPWPPRRRRSPWTSRSRSVLDVGRAVTGRGARRGVGQARPPGRRGRRGARGPSVRRVGARRLRRWHVRARHRPADRGGVASLASTAGCRPTWVRATGTSTSTCASRSSTDRDGRPGRARRSGMWAHPR